MNNIISSRLKSLQNGRNAAEFARDIGMHQQTLDRYIKGRTPNGESIIAICKACGVSADWLLGLTDERKGHFHRDPELTDSEKVSKMLGIIQAQHNTIEDLLSTHAKHYSPASAAESSGDYIHEGKDERKPSA